MSDYVLMIQNKVCLKIQFVSVIEHSTRVMVIIFSFQFPQSALSVI